MKAGAVQIEGERDEVRKSEIWLPNLEGSCWWQFARRQCLEVAWSGWRPYWDAWLWWYFPA